MLNLNRVEVIGNLTRDPELRYTPNGQAVASFAIATNRRYQDQNNNWVDAPPEYHEVVVWGKLAEGVNQVLNKGVRIYAAGRQQTRSWEAPDGTKRYKTELVADTLIGPDQISKAAYSQNTYNSPIQQGPKPSPSTPQTQTNTPESITPASDQNTNIPAKNDQPASDDDINIEDIPF